MSGLTLNQAAELLGVSTWTLLRWVGSGMNYKKKELVRLIKLITLYKVETLVLTDKDRLLRFGSDLIFTLCEQFGTEVVIINSSGNSTFKEELA